MAKPAGFALASQPPARRDEGQQAGKFLAVASAYLPRVFSCQPLWHVVITGYRFSYRASYCQVLHALPHDSWLSLHWIKSPEAAWVRLALFFESNLFSGKTVELLPVYPKGYDALSKGGAELAALVPTTSKRPWAAAEHRCSVRLDLLFFLDSARTWSRTPVFVLLHS